jgi:hypothetical protein
LELLGFLRSYIEYSHPIHNLDDSDATKNDPDRLR